MRVFGTMAARFHDDGVTALYQALKVRLTGLGMRFSEGRLPVVAVRHSTNQTPIVPAARVRYLAEISDTVRGYKARARSQARLARELPQLNETARMLHETTRARRREEHRAATCWRARPAPGRRGSKAVGAVAGDAEGLRRR